MHKNVSRNTCCFHHIAVFANDKALFCGLSGSIHHFEHVIKQKTHIFTNLYQIFLKIHEILPKVKLFTKSGHTERRPFAVGSSRACTQASSSEVFSLYFSGSCIPINPKLSYYIHWPQPFRVSTIQYSTNLSFALDSIIQYYTTAYNKIL